MFGVLGSYVDVMMRLRAGSGHPAELARRAPPCNRKGRQEHRPPASQAERPGARTPIVVGARSFGGRTCGSRLFGAPLFAARLIGPRSFGPRFLGP
eukprot:1790671-Rhodomonas_salina.2